MILLLDAGNSIINIGIHDGDKIVKTFSLETKKIRTKDEFAVILISLLNFNGIRKEEITAGVLASVVPSVNKPIIEAMEAYFSISMIIVEPGVKTGIKLKVDNPKEVGADLLADALAGHIKYSGDILIVNCGTATKYSVVDKDGIFIGVAIAPGFEIGSEGLFRKTAQLPDVGLKIPKEIIGRNSVDCMASGLYFSFGESLKGYIKLIKQKYGDNLKVILSGGIGSYFKEYLSAEIDYYDRNLTLEGLKIIYDKNKDQ